MHRPIEATAVLLLLFEFTRTNSTFNSVLIDYLSPDLETPGTSKPIHGRLPLTILTLSSYLITHASSTASPRAAAYANLCLNVLLAFVENGALLRALTPPVPQTIRLCRQASVPGPEYVLGWATNKSQRQPLLPIIGAPSSPLCSILDCCVLWLRHNLHKRLDTASYL